MFAPVFRFDNVPAMALALMVLTGVSLAKGAQNSNRSQSITILSNGTVIASIGRTEKLGVSSDAPGMITITSGPNSVSVRSDFVTLSGTVGLTPVATTGVTVTPNEEGGYTAILDSSTELDLGR